MSHAVGLMVACMVTCMVACMVACMVTCHAGSERNKLSRPTEKHLKQTYSIIMKCWTMSQSASHKAML